MIDRKYIGKIFPLHTAEVEKSALRLSVKVIGETDPVYSDESAARAVCTSQSNYISGQVVVCGGGISI
jgi:hypothetical protein